MPETRVKTGTNTVLNLCLACRWGGGGGFQTESRILVVGCDRCMAKWSCSVRLPAQEAVGRPNPPAPLATSGPIQIFSLVTLILCKVWSSKLPMRSLPLLLLPPISRFWLIFVEPCPQAVHVGCLAVLYFRCLLLGLEEDFLGKTRVL